MSSEELALTGRDRITFPALGLSPAAEVNKMTPWGSAAQISCPLSAHKVKPRAEYSHYSAVHRRSLNPSHAAAVLTIYRLCQLLIILSAILTPMKTKDGLRWTP